MGADALARLIDRIDFDEEEIQLHANINPAEGNKPLSQSKGVELVNQINQTDEAGTVDAILKSVRAGA